MRLFISFLCLCLLHLAATNVENLEDGNYPGKLKQDDITRVIHKDVERFRRKRVAPAVASKFIATKLLSVLGGQLLTKVFSGKSKGGKGTNSQIGSNASFSPTRKLIDKLLEKLFSGKARDQIHDELTDYLTEWQKNSDMNAAEVYMTLNRVIDSLAKKNSDVLTNKAKIEIIPQRGMHLGDMFSPPGYKIRTSSVNSKSEPDGSLRRAYSYDSGIGNVIINGCYQPSLTVNDPCHEAKRRLTLCNKMLEGTTFIGVGFDGRGTFTSSSRRKSVIQRVCLRGGSYDNRGVPDSMTVHGIYDTDVKTMTFSSMSQYQRYLEKKAAVANSGYMFMDAVHKAYGSSSGSLLGFARGSSHSSHSETHSSRQWSSSQSSHSISQEDRFRQMYMSMLVVDVARYDIFMDDVKPHDLNMDFLHDLVSLPTSYFSAGGPQKFQNFLLRYGTHYIKSAKFGGSLRLFKVKQASKTESIEQFSRKAQADYRAMFSTYQASMAQYKSRHWLGKGSGGKSNRISHGYAGAGAAESETQSSDREVEQQKYSNEVLTVEGGDQKIAAVISEMYTVGFKHELVDWLQSIPTYPKPIGFQMAMLSDLCNINYKHLFPAGVVDFGCFGREKLLIESGTNRKYYMWNTSNINDDNTTFVKSERRYCDFSNQQGLEKAMKRRCQSLRRAINIYLEEGPVPVNDIHLPPGRAGCDTSDLSYDDVRHDLRTPTWDKLIDGRQFKVIFDMPEDIRGVTERSSILTAFFRKSNKRWYVKNADGVVHLYDGWGNGGSGNVTRSNKKMSLRGLVLSYDAITGLLQLTQADYDESVKVLPDLSSNLTNRYLARVEYLHILNEIQKHKNEFGIGSVPCNVVWSNAHSINPTVASGHCISFAAISEGDIFVVFAAIPRDKTTWYYVQISPHGVAIYKGFRIMKFISDRSAQGLGDTTLLQLYFVCVEEKRDLTAIIYGKTTDSMERGHVFGTFHDTDANIQVRFYAFGNGVKEVEIMDAHVLRTAAMGEHVCVGDTIQFEGKCVENCHPQCFGCHQPHSPTSCRKCRNYKLDLKCVAACPLTHRTGPDNITCTCKVMENGVCVEKCSNDRMPVERSDRNKTVQVCVCRFFHPDSKDSCLPGCPLTSYSKELPNAQTECLLCDGVCKPQGKGVPVCTGPTHTGCTDCFTLPGQSNCILCGAGSYLDHSTLFHKSDRCDARSVIKSVTSSNYVSRNGSWKKTGRYDVITLCLADDSEGSAVKVNRGSNSQHHLGNKQVNYRLYQFLGITRVCGKERYNRLTMACCRSNVGVYSVYSRFEQKCCPFGVVDQSQSCFKCGGIGYNPRTHGCCGSNRYSKTVEKCCPPGVVYRRSQNCPSPKKLSTRCKACMPGYRCPGDSRWYKCSIRLNQKSAEGGLSCVACPNGSWSTIPPSQSCHQCPPGFYKKTPSSRCIQCPGKTAGRNCQVTCKCLYGRCIKVDGSCSCWQFFKGHRCEIPTDGALRLVDDRIINQYIAIADTKTISGKVNTGSIRHHPESKPKFAVIEKQLRANVEDKQLHMKFEPMLKKEMDFSGEIRGRLEVYHNGQWGTVCGHKWTYLNTKVACRQFSYNNGVVKTNAFYGAGEGPIWFKWIRCLGYEHRLLSCPRVYKYWVQNGRQSSNCRHTDDIGLICY